MHSAKLYGQVETNKKLKKMAEEKKEQPKKEVEKKAAPKKAAPKVDLDTRPFTPKSR